MTNAACIERLLTDKNLALDLVDVQKLLRFFGFHSIRANGSFTFLNHDECVEITISVASWQEAPVRVVLNLREELEAWLGERRDADKPPFEIDADAFGRLMDKDRLLRRRIRRDNT